jgi:UDP-2-acetamido-3-amino-2,3-dideoxy-glucuronate N-acetyltransferase
MRGGTHPSAVIHPGATVDPSCGINADVVIWHGASVTRGAVLGPGCSVAPNAMLDGCRFGARCRIGPQVSMGPGFVVGDDCFIGPSVTFCNDAWPRADKTGFDIDALLDGSLVTIRIGNRVGIGANAVLLPGITVGDDAFIAAQACCDRDVPAGHLFKRDGSIVEINTAWTRRRMRRAA